MLDALRVLKNGWVDQDDAYGRRVISGWVRDYAPQTARILDVGAGVGDDLIAVSASLPRAVTFGLDIMEENVSACRALGINAARINLEVEQIPFDDEQFEVVIANQVFEHLKNWVHVLHQIALRLLPDGLLVVGVPNLAAWHNRLLLALGRQPTCIAPGGMHVRGFTAPGLRSVLEYDRVFTVERIAGMPFYPFPPVISDALSAVFPNAAASLFLLARKTGSPNSLLQIESMRKQEEFQGYRDCAS